ncbi:aldo/keto reductase [Thaumasiovibrio sp. DFM-14]|uniref:aldo/keto reductase n=1 Tax=Thaumasiovibrio sp. DFM-14 TaxID=3384792 RepID=UPI00399FB612
MQTRKLGNSALNISVLGLGSWAIGGDIGDWGWGKQSTPQSIKVIHAALEHGINWIDTAPAYGLGNAELIIAKALKQTHHKPYIFTKCGFRWREGDSELIAQLDRKSILEEVDSSLSRLSVECIDLYQIHSPNPDSQLEEAWQTLSELQQAGKVRHIGVSNFSKQQLQRVHTIAPVTSLQPPYSLINRQVEEEVLPWCQQQKVGVIHHSSMSHGLLTGKWSHQRIKELDQRDWRHKSHQFQDPHFSKVLALVDKLASLAHAKQCSIAQLCLAWTLSHPATTGTIIGARDTLQLDELLPAANLSLSQADLAVINDYCNCL